MWYEHFANGQMVPGAFGPDVPLLERVRIEQLLYSMPPSLEVCLNLEDYPKTVPDRWKLSGYNALQLRMSFLVISDLEAHQKGELQSQMVRVEVHANRVLIETHEKDLILTAQFYQADLEFFPYVTTDYEYFPHWYVKYSRT